MGNGVKAYEVSVRVPLIISVPGSGSAGRRASGIGEVVDLLPDSIAALLAARSAQA